jgi:mannosyltransferase OCH1-like enzyme
MSVKIHQIAPDNIIQWHPIWSKCQKSVKEVFVDYDYTLWNDHSDLMNFINKHYSQYSQLMMDFPYDIMRIDFARLAILHYFGGIYIDMDVYVYRDFYKEYIQKQQHQTLFFVENGYNEFNKESIPYENCLMVSEPGHDFLLNAMENCKDTFYRLKPLHDIPTISKNWWINQITGSNLLIQSRNPHDTNEFSLLDFTLFNNRPASYSPMFFCKHLHSGVWGTEKIKNLQKSHFVIHEGILFQSYSNTNDNTNDNDTIIAMKDFDFYYDYTEGKFFNVDRNNLHELKKEIFLNFLNYTSKGSHHDQ